MRDRALAWVTVDSPESNTNESEPSAIERRAAARAECAYIRRRGFVLRNQFRTHDDAELVGPDGRVGRERGAGRAPAHRTMAINDRSKPAIDFITDVSAKTSPSDHSLLSPLDLLTDSYDLDPALGKALAASTVRGDRQESSPETTAERSQQPVCEPPILEGTHSYRGTRGGGHT